ncbi:uncharacterized protein LOC126260816 [Schistocerca nitens]|uniref:uncharacterized protein LOC126260816 n=1 Tax=Schistocerca nitens TaxID=7011 RepID=UPI0021198A82|nr:uncharacterized protein LOC126260816 [Schistocerca nitens]
MTTVVKTLINKMLGVEEFVPLSYCPIVKCYAVLKSIHLEGTGPIPDVVVCTDTGQIVEFLEKRVVGIFDSENTNVEYITPFIKYTPPRLYYILKSADSVIVISRTGRLQLYTTFKNVYKIQVSDFKGTGTPQLGIWQKIELGNSEPSVVTDFSEETVEQDASTSSEFYNLCSSMLQELAIKVKEAQVRLKEKQQFRTKLYYIASNTNFAEESETETSLVSQVGQKCGYVDSKNHELDTLVVTNTWHYVHNDKWIVGACVNNTSERCITDINLVFSNSWKQPVTYSSFVMNFEIRKVETQPGKLLKLSKPVNPMNQWKRISELPAHEQACIAGVLPLPKFVEQKKFEISGTIKYSVKDLPSVDYQTTLPNYQLNVLDVVSGNLAPFSCSSGKDLDTLAVRLASEHVSLVLSNCCAEVKKTIVKDLSFEEKSHGILWNSGKHNSELHGTMLLVSGTVGQTTYLHVYARDVSQVILLVHCLYSVLTVHTTIELLIPKGTIKPMALWEALCSEMDYLIKNICSWGRQKEDSSEGNYKIIIDRQAYTEFMSKLSVLEQSTDACHQKLLAAMKT